MVDPAGAKSAIALGYHGFFIDDVNIDFRVSDDPGKPVAPIDARPGQPMSWKGLAELPGPILLGRSGWPCPKLRLLKTRSGLPVLRACDTETRPFRVELRLPTTSTGKGQLPPIRPHRRAGGNGPFISSSFSRRGYEVDLGEPAGPRTYDDGVFRRKFSVWNRFAWRARAVISDYRIGQTLYDSG